ncbi:DMT family transporter [Rhizobiaceae bacterium BDR2-2]|uniref:DMT family transporter n=1 Tax=Ectorhizobium quercum TaxID=2965071 RepID=A0AAE3SVR7_9HYPH|nr:DMT family transporter [Ectorhizobium quercum]MCX8996670.1 DMT family transporter [Ectorhizobium quercum]
MTARENQASPRRHNTYASGREKISAHLAMLLFAALISGSFSFGGMIAREVSPAPLMLLRYIVTIATMGVIAFGLARQPFRMPEKPLRFLVLGALLAVYMLTMFVALEITSPVQTGAVFTLMPLISAVFAFLILGQKTRGGVLASLLIAAAGAIWVIFHGDLDAILGFDVGRGELIFFIGVASHALYVPLLRFLDRRDHPLVFGFWLAIGTCFWLAVSALPQLLEVDYGALGWRFWAILVYIGTVTTAGTFQLLQYASMRLPASKVLGYGYLTPTSIIVFEAALGNGWTSLSVMLGAAVTACGLLVMALLPD